MTEVAARDYDESHMWLARRDLATSVLYEEKH